MNIHESAENYLECILVLSKEKGSVRSIDVAHRMGVTKPSVSYTMKHFRENGYIIVDAEGHITLTQKALEIAERIYERHLTLTELLIRLGVNEKTAKEDACRMEHDISDITFDCIKKHLKDKV